VKIVIIISGVLIVLFSCHSKNENLVLNADAEKKIIGQKIRNTIEWGIGKDTTLLYSIIANDEDFLEVHPDNRVVKGITEFRKAEKFWLDPKFKVKECKIWDMKIDLSKDGSVAWFFCRLNDIGEWDGQPTSWENTRWTGVLEKREGQWRMVQQHFSFAQE
jgi:ketosteroid isomerase-like protein